MPILRSSAPVEIPGHAVSTMKAEGLSLPIRAKTIIRSAVCKFSRPGMLLALALMVPSAGSMWRRP